MAGSRKTIVVIGNGMVGQRFVEKLVEFDTARGFYFLHSYYFDAANDEEIAARVTYGADLPCAVQRANVYGVQFHPEKSHSNGTRLFENFAALV